MKKFPLKRILLSIVLGGGVLLLVLLMGQERERTVQTIVVQDAEYTVYLSDTDETRVEGLSNILELPPDIDGMLFIFPRPDLYGFWMKDMHFPIDMYWLDANMKVVHRELNVAPESFPTVYEPSEPAVYVLEIPSEREEFPTLALGNTIELLTEEK